MSIIHDALKKARGGNEQQPSEPNKALGNLEVDYDNKRSRINWGPLFVLAVILLIAGPIIAPLFSSPFGSQSAVRANNEPSREVLLGGRAGAPGAQPIVTRKGQFGIEEAARPAMFGANMPRLSLSGVVYSQEGSYVILNDQVLRVGEELNGAKLVGVTPDAVTLLVRGETVTLPV